MDFSITRLLYEWMHEKRIVTVVAQQMGVKDATLSAQLRPSNMQAKLGADELVPLFQAIRKIGYGKELEGILRRFVEAMRGPGAATLPDEDLVPQVLVLAKGLGMLSSCAARLSGISNEAELKRLRTMIRTEILPVVLKMEDILSRRIQEVQNQKNAIGNDEGPAPATS